ncbi:putative ATPase AAA+ superfamily [groundwater metagenome]
MYYWKNSSECDFLVKEREKITDAIQVCYELSEKNKEREINGLIEAMEEFKLNEGLIITNDFEGEEALGGKRIIYTPLWKWLL